MENFQHSGLLRLLSSQPNTDASQACYPLSVTAETVMGRTPDCQIMLGHYIYFYLSKRFTWECYSR